MTLWTPEELYSHIRCNPGISYKEITQEFNQTGEFQRFRDSLRELSDQKKIHVVRYTGWLDCALLDIRYYVADRGSITVLDVDRPYGCETVLEYDPYETRKRAVEETE